MAKYVRIVDNFVQEIVDCENIDSIYHPDCGFRSVSEFANEPNILDEYDSETNSFREFVPAFDPNAVYPIVKGQIPVTEVGAIDGSNQ
jgi:hypothetical protein